MGLQQLQAIMGKSWHSNLFLVFKTNSNVPQSFSEIDPRIL